MNLSIIIVNYNTQEHLLRCLESIYKNTPGIELEIIVIDNNSKDKSIPLLKASFPQVTIIENKINTGFAKAVNQGILRARSDFILCLNNDTVVLPLSLNKLLDFMHSHPDAIAAGGKVLNSDGSIQFSCRRFPDYLTAFFNRASLLTRIFKNNRFSKNYLMSDYSHDRALQVDWVSACYLIMRKAAIEKVGFMDEGFFMYCEDVDWCYRAKKIGLKVYYAPDCPIIHLNKGYGSNFANKIIEHHKSMYRFYRKHFRRNLFTDIAVPGFICIRAIFILLQNNLANLLSLSGIRKCA